MVFSSFSTVVMIFASFYQVWEGMSMYIVVSNLVFTSRLPILSYLVQLVV